LKSLKQVINTRRDVSSIRTRSTELRLRTGSLARPRLRLRMRAAELKSNAQSLVERGRSESDTERPVPWSRPSASPTYPPRSCQLRLREESWISVPHAARVCDTNTPADRLARHPASYDHLVSDVTVALALLMPSRLHRPLGPSRVYAIACSDPHIAAAPTPLSGDPYSPCVYSREPNARCIARLHRHA
jgi:hypothetical protein